MKLLPFDLAKAQAGHPWGTRDGRKGKKIFDTDREGYGVHNSYYRLFAVLENDEDFLYNIDGRYEAVESHNDLFLYEEDRVGW